MLKRFFLSAYLIPVLCLTPTLAYAVAGYDCTAPYPCDKATVAECEADLEANVCWRDDCTCIPLYYTFPGSTKKFSYVCDKFKKPVLNVFQSKSLDVQYFDSLLSD